MDCLLTLVSSTTDGETLSQPDPQLGAVWTLRSSGISLLQEINCEPIATSSVLRQECHSPAHKLGVS